MSGISFMVNERSQKTAAVIDLRKHEQLWEVSTTRSLLIRARTSRVKALNCAAAVEI